MKNIRINFEKKTITMTRKFAALAEDPFTDEFAKLQEVRNAYPKFKVLKHKIKKNPNKKTYPGLTYEYIEDFIRLHEEGKKLEEMLDEYNELRLIAKCHHSGVGYATIKKWFLDNYEGVEIFGESEERIREIRERRAEQAAKKLQVVKTEESIA